MSDFTYKAYPRHLYSAGKGHALWHPDPQEPSVVRSVRRAMHAGDVSFVRDSQWASLFKRAVHVGDVGFVRDGRWTTLFNLHSRPMFKASQKTPVERVMKRIGVSTESTQRATQWSANRGVVVSRTYQDPGLSPVHKPFSFDGDAAVAHGAFAEEEATTKHFQGRYAKYACDNVVRWRTFFREQSMDVQVSDLIIVTACTRSTLWENSVRCRPVASSSTSSDLASTNSDDIIHNSGPVNSSSSLRCDKSLFVKGYKIGTADDYMTRFRSSSAAGGQSMFQARERNSRADSSSLDASNASPSRPPSYITNLPSGQFDTASILSSPLSSPRADTSLDWRSLVANSSRVDFDWKSGAVAYILENCTVALAVVHDDDLAPYASEMYGGKEIYDILRERQPRIYIHESDGVSIGSLSYISSLEQGANS